MRTVAVIEVDVAGDPRPRVGNRVVRVEIHFFVLDRSPEAFDENIVAPTALAVHAQLRGDAREDIDEGVARELRALIGIEYFRATVLGDRSFKGSDAEVGCKANRNRPSENLARCPRIAKR